MASKSSQGQYLYLEGSSDEFQMLIVSLEPCDSPPPPKGLTYTLSRWLEQEKDFWTPCHLGARRISYQKLPPLLHSHPLTSTKSHSIIAEASEFG